MITMLYLLNNYMPIIHPFTVVIYVSETCVNPVLPLIVSVFVSLEEQKKNQSSLFVC